MIVEVELKVHWVSPRHARNKDALPPVSGIVVAAVRRASVGWLVVDVVPVVPVACLTSLKVMGERVQGDVVHSLLVAFS